MGPEDLGDSVIHARGVACVVSKLLVSSVTPLGNGVYISQRQRNEVTPHQTLLKCKWKGNKSLDFRLIDGRDPPGSTLLIFRFRVISCLEPPCQEQSATRVLMPVLRKDQSYSWNCC